MLRYFFQLLKQFTFKIVDRKNVKHIKNRLSYARACKGCVLWIVRLIIEIRVHTFVVPIDERIRFPYITRF